MPYITKEDREKYNPILRELRDKIVENCSGVEDAAGVLNYCMTVLSVAVFEKLVGKLRYWHYALLSGVFDNVKTEFYRRKAVPYEDLKIDENGDVSAYE